MIPSPSGLQNPTDPIRDRDDLRRLVRELTEPLVPRFSDGRARLRLGPNTAHHDDAAAELEAFARPLWGLAPLAAGGGEFAHWDLWRRGLASGTDPGDPEFWGPVGDTDQRLVETAALGLALALAPEEVWDPLTGRERDALAAWLLAALDARPVDNNWQFFPVMVGLGLDRVGVAFDHGPNAVRLDRLESFDLGGGWYSDGPNDQRDYYVPFAMHYYGLIYARLAGERDPGRARRFRERAAAFAQDFQHWFASDGSAVPYGRSLTYRFAQGAFWGALAFADVEALPWPVVKGHLLRHLRWWLDRPIRDADGLLTVGYGYAQPMLAEQYNAPGSPYWSMKAFLPLALPGGHPFWTAPEHDAPALPAVSTQPQAGAALMRGGDGRHVVLLSARQHHNWVRHGAAKYAKFAYSTLFGFSVPAGSWGLEQGAFDSTLALSEDGAHWRPCEVPTSPSASDGVLHARWTPWPDVEVETWLLALAPWHVRVHRVRTGRALTTAEGAFAVDRDPAPRRTGTGPGHARIDSPAGLCVIEDLLGGRAGDLVRALPGTNVLARRTVIPTLTGDLAPGEHLLACAVLGAAGAPEPVGAGSRLGDPGSPEPSGTGAWHEPSGAGAWPEPPAWETVAALLRAFGDRGHPGLPEDGTAR
ncbi:DUF2264 domain-containing protein [Planotetraspora phitsanulokensis]|uniref:DUF2264 domain-containing protein n=1 Tax=Planotetraspora phitsanulokensis TaxID=575192 RepID=A0A8J3U2M4_9ACTN|nr:DUF2264 domain-containing protein [Planotetraspora phitsanulokensis]GII36151.1 hypothetical protein Pph01_11540 [Planotetraspora phitsanulokensis]